MSSSEQTETAAQSLEDILFAREALSVFAILDGASIPGLVKTLYEFEPEFCCLYRGELKPDMASVAPYLVRLEKETEFANIILSEGWGLHWGTFLWSNATVRALRDHFRQFQTVELPDQRTVIFRYYDPRVLRYFLPVCTAEELDQFFGPVQNFLIEFAPPAEGMRFARSGPALKSEAFQVKKTKKG